MRSFQSALRQQIPDGGRAAGCTVPGRVAEVRVPEHVVPIGMRGEACHDGLAQLAKVVREGGHFVARDAGVDEQHTVPALHDNGIALDELALVNQNALSDLLQHEMPSACGVQPLVATVLSGGSKWQALRAKG